MKNDRIFYLSSDNDSVRVSSFFIFKKASGTDGILAMIKNVNLYIGGFLYLASAILNIWLLRYLEYSVVLPLTSLTYIWTMVFSYMILKEKITKKENMWSVLDFDRSNLRFNLKKTGIRSINCKVISFQWLVAVEIL